MTSKGFKNAIENCCECADDGTAQLKQPFLHPYLDARAADTRMPMVGAIDIKSETNEQGGISVTQTMFPLEYECLLGTNTPTRPPISPLRANS